MRTISVTLKVQTDVANTVEISTEVIVSDGEEQDAGVEARAALDRFIDGYTSS